MITESICVDSSWKHFEFQSTNDGIAGLTLTELFRLLCRIGMQMSMTRVGRMLVKEGFTNGVEETKMADARNLIDVLDVTVIAERIGLPIETVQKIKEEYLASQSKIQ